MDTDNQGVGGPRVGGEGGPGGGWVRTEERWNRTAEVRAVEELGDEGEINDGGCDRVVDGHAGRDEAGGEGDGLKAEDQVPRRSCGDGPAEGGAHNRFSGANLS